MFLVKWTLLATTGSSQPLMIFQMPGWIQRRFVNENPFRMDSSPWNIQGDLCTRTTPRLSG